MDEDLCDDKDVPVFRSITKKLKPSSQRTRVLTEVEYDRLIRQFDTFENPFNTRTRKRMIIFDVETGLRREELLTLLELDCQFIEKGFDRDGIIVRATKNGKDRWVPLSALGKQQLHEQLHENRLQGTESQYVFPKSDGSRFSEFRKGFKLDCERADIKDLRVHDLRRTFGTWQLCGIRCKKKRIEEVSKLLGHSDISITQKAYAFLENRDIDI